MLTANAAAVSSSLGIVTSFSGDVDGEILRFWEKSRFLNPWHFLK